MSELLTVLKAAIALFSTAVICGAALWAIRSPFDRVKK